MKITLLFMTLILMCKFCGAQEVNSKILQQLAEMDTGYQFPDHAWLISSVGDTINFESLKGNWTILDYW